MQRVGHCFTFVFVTSARLPGKTKFRYDKVRCKPITAADLPVTAWSKWLSFLWNPNWAPSQKTCPQHRETEESLLWLAAAHIIRSDASSDLTDLTGSGGDVSLVCHCHTVTCWNRQIVQAASVINSTSAYHLNCLWRSEQRSGLFGSGGNPKWGNEVARCQVT